MKNSKRSLFNQTIALIVLWNFLFSDAAFALRQASFVERQGNLARTARYSVLSWDPGSAEDSSPKSIGWAKAHNFNEVTFNPNNISLYLMANIDKYRPAIRELLRRGLAGVELEHALIERVIKELGAPFKCVSYEVDADIEVARFKEDWAAKSQSERDKLEADMVQRTVKEILRISNIDRKKMLVKVPNTPVGHRAVEIVKKTHPDVRINFTLFFNLEDSQRGVRFLTKDDDISIFASRTDALTQDKSKGIPLKYAQGLVSFIIIKQFYDWCKETGVDAKIILASLAPKIEGVPAYIYVQMLTGGGQVLTMPGKQAMAIEETEGLEIRANLDLPMEDFLSLFIMNEACRSAARKLGYWPGYTEGEMTLARARELARLALAEWEGLDAAIKQERMWDALNKDAFDKFIKPFLKAREIIAAVVKEEAGTAAPQAIGTDKGLGVGEQMMASVEQQLGDLVNEIPGPARIKLVYELAAWRHLGYGPDRKNRIWETYVGVGVPVELMDRIFAKFETAPQLPAAPQPAVTPAQPTALLGSV